MAKRTNLTTLRVISVFLVALGAAATAAGGTIYVDADAGGANNGSSWTDAYRCLQNGLAVAWSGDEIRVAQGIYKPDEDSAHPNGTGYRTATFRLKNGVAIKGGYAGFGEPDPDARDIEVYETVLSGDLLGNDGPDFANNYENSYHVVTGSGTYETAVLDGFTITAGNANGGYWPHDCGGGMYNENSSPTLTNCTFSDNLAQGEGGGMYNWQSSPTLTNCTFSGNSAGWGGGMNNSDGSSPTLTDCTFTGNSAEHGDGGGMASWDYSSPTLTNCTFNDNQAENGGGMGNHTSSPTTLTNCTFTGNSAVWSGGGMANSGDSSATLTNCTFNNNSADAGGGMNNYGNSNSTVTNCTFIGNSAEAGGGMINYESSPTVTNCTFIGNSADGGGGMHNAGNCNTTVTNCTFSGNSAANGGGGGMINYESSPTVTNCILWGNTAPSGPQIYNDGTSSATVTYSDVQGGWPGEGNIDSDPRFVGVKIGEPPEDAIAHWKLDEGEGTVAYDSAGENDGTIYGAQWTTGQIGGALDFDGVDDYVEIAWGESLANVADNFTILLWAQPLSTHQIDPESNSGWGGTSGQKYAIGPSQGDNYWGSGHAGAGISIGTNGISVYEHAAYYMPAVLVWSGSVSGITHVAVVYSDKQPRLYINGESKKTGQQSSKTVHIWPHYIGGHSYGYFNGLIDDVRIYNRVLSAEEIQQFYQMDYHLLPDSPCIDVGDNSAVPPSVLTDLDGKPRIINDTVDMGAYEFHCPGILYVDADAEGANDGSSWEDAFNYLQDALATAWNGDEIRVAQGVYKPAELAPPPPPPLAPTGGSNSEDVGVTAGGREATFQLINGVAIKGGYAGFGEPDPNARDIELYETILSGDLYGNDGPDFANNWDNSYHVVTGSGTDATAVLDGFTITAGNANGSNPKDSGGGMYNDSGSPTVRDCTFSGNSAGKGGGMYNDESSPTVTNCIFGGNSANAGGGMYNDNSSPTIANCIFSENSAVGKYGDGGGMHNNESSPTLTNCTFSRNSADRYGGAMNSYRYRKPTLTNCILWGNTPEEISVYGRAPIITYSNVQGGWPGEGNIDADPRFVEPGYLGPISYWKFDEGSGITAYDSVGDNDGTIYGAVWTTGQVGGALSFDGVDDYVRTANNVFTNAQLASGATLSAWFNTDSTAHCYIADNEGYLTLGVNHIYAANPNKLCGIVDGGHHRYFSSSDVTDNLWHHAAIVWDGTDTATLHLDGVNVSSGVSGPPTPDSKTRPFTIGAHSTIAAYFNGLIDDVRIYNRALSAEEIQQLYQIGLTGLGGYHLLADSPCINAGDPDYVAGPNETDLDGKPRVIGGRIDMGAYEFNHIPVACIVGGERIVECEGCWGVRVTLDGSCSSDADSAPGTNDDIVSFDWYKVDACDPNFEDFLASGEIIDCNLPLGEHIIVLEVIDKADAFDTNEVTIIVQDTTPPDFALSVTPTMLWPVNHKMVLITPSWTASDICDASPEVSLVSITMNEGDEAKGDGHTTLNIQIGDDGSIYLRAERSGTGSGRIYTITYQAVDDSGNTAVASARVTVPHDQR